MRVTKRTNIAMRVLMFCATNVDRLVTKAEIAAVCQCSENHLAQVINQLGQTGFVTTQRGRNGGIRLARAAEAINVGDVFRVVEGAVPLAECFADVDNSCPLISACRLRLALRDAAEAFYAHLDGITLEALTCDNAPLQAILGQFECKQSEARAPA
ncbi:Rrf2 family transcriptional regulator [Lentibacter algarum]|uniref:RrF2 family transcriptional regulator n=1 Tax=Lentibacter algarum TaxID=576131 RepID=UPI001C07B925|nr:Rrf2 family transcriptional regulator [Lentibacter algarum]MBU2980886.1 Rrf2 family transcriptional regulator [Lentibacter algarum]